MAAEAIRLLMGADALQKLSDICILMTRDSVYEINTSKLLDAQMTFAFGPKSQQPRLALPRPARANITALR